MVSATVFTLLSLAIAGTPGTFGVGINKERTFADVNHKNALARERFDTRSSGNTIPESLAKGYGSYFATLYIGSDKQKVKAQLDTGSSDLWVMLSSNPYCNQPDFDCSGSIFDPSSSNTFHNTSAYFDTSYYDTTGASGFLAQDDIEVGGATIKGGYFAAADTANASTNVFGVGAKSNEATLDNDPSYTYTTIPESLKQQGYIDRLAYSLYLNDPGASTGQILFGGVDHAQYQGDLGLVPIVNVYPGSVEYYVMLHEINLRYGGWYCPFLTMNLPVLLDSGTSDAVLLKVMIDSMAAAIGYSNYDDDIGYYYGPCDESELGIESFELNFSGVKLQVPPVSLLEKAYDVNGYPIMEDGVQQCILAIEEGQEAGDMCLGDSILRNFYVVYDLESQQIALGQTSVNAAESDVEAIGDSIPSAYSAPSYSSTQYNIGVTTPTDYGSCEATS